jgi:hypothetical protein
MDDPFELSTRPRPSRRVLFLHQALMGALAGLGVGLLFTLLPIGSIPKYAVPITLLLSVLGSLVGAGRAQQQTPMFDAELLFAGSAAAAILVLFGGVLLFLSAEPLISGMAQAYPRIVAAFMGIAALEPGTWIGLRLMGSAEVDRE